GAIAAEKGRRPLVLTNFGPRAPGYRHEFDPLGMEMIANRYGGRVACVVVCRPSEEIECANFIGRNGMTCLRLVSDADWRWGTSADYVLIDPANGSSRPLAGHDGAAVASQLDEVFGMGS